MSKDESKPEASKPTGGIFLGLGNLLKVAADLADTTDCPVEIDKTDSKGIGLKAVYGVSVRIGPRLPPGNKFRNLRRRPAQPGGAAADVREPAADLFDEGDFYLFVAELPGLDRSAVHWDIGGNKLVIRAASCDRKYHKEIVLPEAVDEQRTTSSYKNGILELRIWKRQAKPADKSASTCTGS